MDVHPFAHARQTPDKIAFKMLPSGVTVTYRELDQRSNRAAQLMRALGLKRGDVVAVLMENHPRYFEIVWAADRAGLYYTGISSRLTPSEAAYILTDSGAKALFTSGALAAVACDALALVPTCVGFSVDGQEGVLSDYVAASERQPVTPIEDESMGAAMLYSSGTTGRPKGVKFALPDTALGALDPLTALVSGSFACDADTIYLCPAPLYHAAALRWSMSIQRLGGTVIVLEKFEPALALGVVAAEGVTHAQWVPTHFVRMLKLPAEERSAHDLSTLRYTWHAAAPCPIAVKQAMLDWWGPIIAEYYAGTEFNGMTIVGPEEWLAHPGTVGKAAFGTIHICGEDGERELAPRENGLVYFEGGSQFSYHHDPDKTRQAYNSKGWSSLGDIGWLDEDGYLYLTDRKSFTIISGGVNIYPQEIEDAIISHPRVMDAAVIGAPDDDLGERVVAIVQPVDWADAGPALADELRETLGRTLSRTKIPRHFDFMAELPRLPTGKLYKRLLRDRYWAAQEESA